MSDFAIKLEPIVVNLTPHALARTSEAFYNAAERVEDKEIWTFKYFLYCGSIEIGIKAIILAKDNSKEMKELLKSKRKGFGHNLIALVQRLEQIGEGQLLDHKSKGTIAMINSFYKDKGLEYFTQDVIFESTSGSKGIPSILELKKVSEKVIGFLVRKSYFS